MEALGNYSGVRALAIRSISMADALADGSANQINERWFADVWQQHQLPPWHSHRRAHYYSHLISRPDSATV
jgi:hypothetical protein